MNPFSRILVSILIATLSPFCFAENNTEITLNPGPRSDKEARFLFEEGFRNLQFDPAESASLLQRLLARYPNYSKRKEAKVALANALYNLKNYKEAKPFFRELLLDSNDLGERESSRLKLAEIDWALKDTTAALTSLHEILQNCKPDSNLSIDALLLRSRIHASMANTAANTAGKINLAQSDYDAAITQSKEKSNLGNNELMTWVELRAKICEMEHAVKGKDFPALKLCFKQITPRILDEDEATLLFCSVANSAFSVFIQNTKSDSEEKSKFKNDWTVFLEESNCKQNG